MYFVYELIDPRTSVTAYIGITYNTNLRLQQHIHDHTNTKKTLWIQELQNVNLLPYMKIIEKVNTREEVLEREIHWIRHYLSLGVPLTNTVIPRSHREQSVGAQPPFLRKNFYTSSEARQLLGVSEFVFRNMIRSGEITKLSMPGRELGIYPKFQIDKLVEKLTLMRAANLKDTEDTTTKKLRLSKEAQKKLETSTAKKTELSEDLYTASQAIEKLGISRVTLSTLVKKGKIDKIIIEEHHESYYSKSVIDEMVLAPQNFYSASTAAKKLGMSKTTFHEYVRKGKIKKVVPPGGTEGYYPKKDIDQMVRAKELFILQYASEPSNFRKATEADLPSLHDLLVSIFGYSNATPFETVKSWYQQNPETYYVLTQENIVTGYVGFLYLKEETTAQIMRAIEPGTPLPDASEVLPFTSGTPIHGLWIGLGVRPGLPEGQARYYGRHLITGAIEVLENLAKRGMPVHKLYATSQTTSGTKLSRDLGFREIHYPNEPLIRFELDLETTQLPLAKEYQAIVRRQQKRSTTKLDFGLALAEDASEIHALTASVSGGEAHAVPAEVLKAWIRKNPWSIHILRRSNEIIGYIAMFPLSEETLMQRLSGKLLNRMMPIDDIQGFTPNISTNLYIAEMAVKHLPEHLKNQEPDFNNPDPVAKQIGARLIKEAVRFVLNLQKQGTTISKVYAVGTSPFGIQICKDLRMKPMDLPEGVRENRIPFQLDLIDDENSRLLRRLLQRTKTT